MKNNKLIIQINKSIFAVFTFTITPPNSTFWISDIIKEETNEWPIRKGTVYFLINKIGELSQYIVTDIKENEFFELVAKDENYHVRYSYRKIDESITELEYYEWMKTGELTDPFTKESLIKLKQVIESL